MVILTRFFYRFQASEVAFMCLDRKTSFMYGDTLNAQLSDNCYWQKEGPVKKRSYHRTYSKGMSNTISILG